jgi:lipopolysaccharide transport protein LptA
VLTRHKLEATGDALLITHPNDKLQTARIEGKPAKFKDFMPKKQEWVTGEANYIIFDQEKDTITLKENAYIVTDKGNQIKADQILLYNKTETFEATGDKKQGTRVQMVIQPE